MFLKVGRKIINTNHIIKAEIKFLTQPPETIPSYPELTLTFAAFDGEAKEMLKETLQGIYAAHVWYTLKRLSHDVEHEPPSTDVDAESE